MSPSKSPSAKPSVIPPANADTGPAPDPDTEVLPTVDAEAEGAEREREYEPANDYTTAGPGVMRRLVGLVLIVLPLALAIDG